MEWKNIPGFEGYMIDDYGNVRKYYRNGKFIDKIPERGKKNLRIEITKNGVRKRIFVHRLVASAHGLQGKEGEVLYHKDGDLQNNHISNLEWIGLKELGKITSGKVVFRSHNFRKNGIVE